MKKEPRALSYTELYQHHIPEDFSFTTTEELDSTDVVIGQDRALEAINFGMRICGDGYNIFVLGAPGVGKLSAVRNVIEQAAAKEAECYDWCYVNDFEQPHRPKALRFPPGIGHDFQQDMSQLIEEFGTTIPAAFESEEYRAKIAELEQEFNERQESSLNGLRDEADKQGIVLMKTPTGFAFVPKGENGEVISPEKFKELSGFKKKRVQKAIDSLQSKLQSLMQQFPLLHKEIREKIKKLDQEMMEFIVGHSIGELKEKYVGLAKVVDYLDALQKDIIENTDGFREQQEPVAMMFGAGSRAMSLQRYQVNLLVNNKGLETAPVIYEDLPSHANLIGRCEYQSQMGTLVTDFTMVKAGALHKANGGYLILDARKVLMQPYAWESLKRTLQAGEIRIESLERTLSLISTASLEPEPVPLNVKVILVGERQIYYLLKAYEPDFPGLFKVAADFEDTINSNEHGSDLYARFIAGLIRKAGLLHLDKGGVARVMEHCARLVGDTEKLTAHFRLVDDLLHESDYWAKQAGRSVITSEDVEQAIDKQIYRADRIRKQLIEETRRGTIIIDTKGETIGQVNALSVISLGDFAFGQPSRVTATTRLGEGEFIDIERETELGGAIHSKGVYILSSFLSSHYARDIPLSLTASVVFEQSYGEVEGDSASLAELCAILSSLAELPLQQSFAMTGSINQHGQVQPIGGVNEKIEGFYDVCTSFGLSGKQGVIIPQRNIKHVILRKDVLAAVKDGQFSIYPVDSVDQAMELLAKTRAGTRDEGGNYPQDSINGLVDNKLLQYANIRQNFAREPAKGKDKISNTDNE